MSSVFVYLRDGIFTFNDIMVYINIFIIFLLIFFQKREPVTIFLWIFVLIFIPIAGFIFYIFLGQQIYKEKRFHYKELEEILSKHSFHSKTSIKSYDSFLLDDSTENFKEIIKYNFNVSKAVYSDNNDVEIFTDGLEKFDSLKKDLLKAKKYIYFQYYIIKDDIVFRSIIPILKQKAKEGVKVCIIYDGMGCRLIKNKVWKDLEKSGIETVSFFPPILGQFNVRANYRNHRKIVVIDGHVGYIGGFNVGKEYISLDKRFGYWRDTHLKIVGEAVSSIEMRFVMDWNYATNKISRRLKFKFNKLYPSSKNKVGIQIISSGPDLTEPIIRDNIIKMISLAKKSVKIQTPYFILDEAMMTALKIALHSGVDVQIMIPNKADHPVVNSASRYFAGQLIELGAKCYEYTKGFIHAKSVVIDDTICTVGTANMDIRSFKLNFEVNAVIFDKEVSKKLGDAFNNDTNDSILVTLQDYRKRGIFRRGKEMFARLFSPIL